MVIVVFALIFIMFVTAIFVAPFLMIRPYGRYKAGVDLITASNIPVRDKIVLYNGWEQHKPFVSQDLLAQLQQKIDYLQERE